jgi:hypothetical protein
MHFMTFHFLFRDRVNGITIWPGFPLIKGPASVMTLFVLFLCTLSLLAQNPVNEPNSIIDKIVNKTDTLVQNPMLSKPAGKWSQFPVISPDTLKTNHNSSRFYREWNNLLQKFYAIQPANKNMRVTNSNLVAFDGMIIRKIEIKKVNVFAKNAMDTSYVPVNWLQKAGTTIHTGTRDKIIKRNLLLKPGDRLDVFMAAENERLIRDMPYIMDARFLARPISGEPDSVDLVLLTRDLWPVGLNIELSSANSGNAGLGYYNIFGYGHQFLTSTYWDGKHNPVFGYQLLYGIPNIKGSFVTTELEYIDRWNTNTGRLRIARDFKTVGFKYAGAAEIENSSLTRDIILPDSSLADQHWKYTNYELWMGRIFQLKRSIPTGISSGLFFSGRIFVNHNYLGPKTSENLFYAFQDKTQLLFSGGYSHQGFRKDNMIYTFDRIEDVPFGYLINFTSGVEWGQYKIRPYLAGSISTGKYFRGTGYLYGLLEYGTFISENSLEQGTLQIQLRSFTRLHTWAGIQYRNFVTLTYLDGINRYKEEFTSLENRGGIHGLTSSPSLRGNEKLTLNLESVVFNRYRFLGFRFAYFGSVDLGFIKNENAGFLDFKPFSGISLGVRIRNDQLIFDTFELKFSFYPGLPGDANPSNFKAGSVPRLRSNGLFPEKPSVIEFN